MAVIFSFEVEFVEELEVGNAIAVVTLAGVEVWRTSARGALTMQGLRDRDASQSIMEDFATRLKDALSGPDQPGYWSGKQSTQDH